MDTKQSKYRNLIERVKTSYPARNPSDDGNEPRLYWCDDCEEINLWTYWQGKGNLDAKSCWLGRTGAVLGMAVLSLRWMKYIKQMRVVPTII